MELFECIGAFAVAAIWGITNPLIRCASTTLTHSDIGNHPNIWQPFRRLLQAVTTPSFSIPFALNQCASLLFIWVLAKLPVTFAVPFVNSLTFLFTAISGQIIGEKKLNAGVIFGAILIVIGTTITVLAN